MVVLGTKMAAAIGLAQLLGVNQERQFAFGFIPYAGLATDAWSFRRVTTLSTLVVGVVAVLWLLIHLARQKHHSHLYTAGVFLTIPMVVLLATFEYFRRIGLDPLLSGTWLMRIAFGAAAATALFAGFYLRASERPIVQQLLAQTPDLQHTTTSSY